MKLVKENFKKDILGGGTILYTYKCKGDKYHIRVMGLGGKDIFVYKNNEFDENYENTFKTTDNLEAWKKFEDLVAECQPSQESSGGFMKNPQDNPNVLPLLAVKNLSGIYKVSVFIQLPDGTQIDWKTIAPEYEFMIPEKAFKKPTNYKSKVFEVDWSGMGLPAIFDGIVFLRYFEKVKYEYDPEAEVFLFIPQNVVNQGGGEEGGEESGEQGGEKGGEKGEGQPKEEGEGKGEGEGEGEGEGKGEGEGEGKGEGKGEGEGEGEGKPDEDSKKKGKGKGKGEGEGEPDEEGEPDGEGDGRPNGDLKGGERKLPPAPEIITGIAKLLNQKENTIKGFFQRVNTGVTFLNINNFNNIKKQLNLPESLTAMELSETINKQI